MFDQGHFHVKGNPSNAKSIGEVAFAAYGANLPEGVDHGLEATSSFDPPNFVWPFGAHTAWSRSTPTPVVEIQK